MGSGGDKPRYTRETLSAYLDNPDRSLDQPLVFPVTINLDMSLADMIKAGDYGWVNENIMAEHFPVEGEGEYSVELEYYRFDRAVRGAEAIKLLDEAGFRPATLAELLVFGATHPEEQRKFPIVAVGSSWRVRDSNLYVPCLCGHSGGRSLGLCWFGREFDSDYRFLVARK